MPLECDRFDFLGDVEQILARWKKRSTPIRLNSLSPCLVPDEQAGHNSQPNLVVSHPRNSPRTAALEPYRGGVSLRYSLKEFWDVVNMGEA